MIIRLVITFKITADSIFSHKFFLLDLLTLDQPMVRSLSIYDKATCCEALIRVISLVILILEVRFRLHLLRLLWPLDFEDELPEHLVNRLTEKGLHGIALMQYFLRCFIDKENCLRYHFQDILKLDLADSFTHFGKEEVSLGPVDGASDDENEERK